MKIKKFFIFIILLTSCYRVEDKIEPKMSYSLQEEHIKSLNSAFTPLTPEEKTQDWAKEFKIAEKFAKELDLYRAVTNFKRAEILFSTPDSSRKQQIEYNIILCYYFGKKHEDVIDYFEKSTLPYVDKSFEAFEDLLIILYESYRELKDDEKTNKILDLMTLSYPKTQEKLLLASAQLEANIEKIKLIAKTNKDNLYLTDIISHYELEKKSVGRAQLLNAVLPGAGYLYIGQKKSALTAFLLNSCFIYAAYEFFNRGYTAAGIITSSFEFGWYFGGIYGAGEEANFYNERIYEKNAKPIMHKEKTFPIFMIQYGF